MCISGNINKPVRVFQDTVVIDTDVSDDVGWIVMPDMPVIDSNPGGSLKHETPLYRIIRYVSLLVNPFRQARHILLHPPVGVFRTW
jgi:hypothetical protein